MKYIFVGLIVSPDSKKDLSLKFGYVRVENGKITKKGSISEFKIFQQSEEFSDFNIIKLTSDQFLLPGFIDCHTHAPQFPNIGLGLDQPLLEWLDKYTFPVEKRYSDVNYSAKVYNQVVHRLLNNGTTTACYFGSLHLEGTLELVKSAIKYGQRALVGKVSMNLKNDAGYYNGTDKELIDVDLFVKTVLAYKNDLVQPVVTPRFALSCDEELMTGLARIANKYGCRTQSHICENREEIDYVLELNPDCNSYGEVYDKSNILNDKCIMAHAVHMTEEEISLLASKSVSVAHCPASNTRLRSGLCSVRRLLDGNITVGLGTDVSGGDSASILDTIRRSMDVSMCLQLQGAEGHALDWKEALFLATLGGARALNLDDKIGSFEEGKEFDALLIDVYANGGPIDRYDSLSELNGEEQAINLVQKFLYLGDDRNIIQAYVKGQRVKDISVNTNN